MTPLGDRLGPLVRVRERAVQRARRVRRERLLPLRPEVVDAVHGHGYLVRPAGDDGRLPDVVRPWPQRRVGPLSLHLHPRTVCSVAGDGPLRAVLLGHPVDVDAGLTDGAEIAERVVRDARTHGDRQALGYAAGLGGRWTLLLLHGPDGGHLTVLPDALASQPVQWTTDHPGGPVVASAASLVAGRSSRLGAGQQVGFGPGGTLVRPAPDPGDGDPDPAGTDAAGADLVGRLSEHLRLLASWGPPVLTVDGGTASRLVLEAFARDPVAGARAITCVTPEQGPSPEVDGMFAASRSCFEIGLPHRVLRARPPARGSAFELIHGTTFPDADPGGTAYALWSQLPHDLVHLHPAGGPVDPDRPAPEPVRVAQEGDLSHRVLLPYNERAILRLLGRR
ncbi:hypothetical protein [Ornithinicoccus hortensis]|uniref:Uncharacterized protein n=1 Tax=Ornithinicoccus hortensis TaxID=82346 RepID=A0A542YMT0_9MICO|nr:hypothetical protein [Ornithinicoccus hortensis]TQL49396.1 hypothetical protein FB467_0466 [Ornithinicoccus hortensis]